MPIKSGELRIGISGWRYEPWRGAFYPKKLRQADELSFASRQLNFIEINGTFYSLQRPSSFQEWYEQTPEDFVFAVKGAQYITHMKRLNNINTPLANYFASGGLALGKKLGPILWQFPPNFKFDEAKLDAFFSLLPRDGKAAAKLAGRHDDKLKTEAYLKADGVGKIRYAVEVRNETFKDEAFIKLLRKHKIALVFVDAAGEWPVMHDLTADFCYIRLHGAEELYVSGYQKKDFDIWSKRIKLWQSGRSPADVQLVAKPMSSKPKSRDIFLTFDNTFKVKAPANAITLAKRLGIDAGEARAKRWKINESES